MSETMEILKYDRQLDLSGLICPLPVLKTKAALAHMAAGQVLKVIVTHPDSRQEFAALCRLPEFELLEQRDEDGHFLYWIKKMAGKMV